MLKAEYLFLENIYSEDQMKKMKIEKLELFKKKIKKIFDNLDDFCESIEQEYKDNPDIEIVSELKKIKTWEDEEKKKKKLKKKLFSICMNVPSVSFQQLK